jgi:hypothetical protein
LDLAVIFRLDVFATGMQIRFETRPTIFDRMIFDRTISDRTISDMTVSDVWIHAEGGYHWRIPLKGVWWLRPANGLFLYRSRGTFL